MVKEVTSVEEWNDVITTNPLVVVDVFADWCGPCRALSPLFEELSAKFPNIKFVKANVENNNIKDLVNFLQVAALPTLAIVKNTTIERKNDVFVGGGRETINNLASRLSSYEGK